MVDITDKLHWAYGIASDTLNNRLCAICTGYIFKTIFAMKQALFIDYVFSLSVPNFYRAVFFDTGAVESWGIFTGK
ncbi:hypothetical protein KUL42_19650 [Alteromonas sp. KUL42]|nr:hypothetical protein KUL42_19650 [Alteromonas sp. KUL42]